MELFGLGWMALGGLAIFMIVGIFIIFEGSGIASAIWIIAFSVIGYKLGGLSLSELLMYVSIYIVLGLLWGTFRLIQDTKKKFKKESELNKDKKEIPSTENTSERKDYEELTEYFRNERYKRTDKEILSTIIKEISYDKFAYRVFYFLIDFIDYVFTDLLKDLFEKIKKMIRSYLFKTILGEDEKKTY